jgi:hypothetical protein
MFHNTSATPPTRCQMHQEQCRCNAQRTGRYRNTTTSSTLVRRNLASHLQGASMCRAELILVNKQIRAAAMHDVRTFSSTTAKGERFRATVEEVHATRRKEKEMVEDLLNGWQKVAHGYILEIKNNKIICLGCEHVNLEEPSGYPAQPKLTWRNRRLPSPTRINLEEP